jgi:hypothetical protein
LKKKNKNGNRVSLPQVKLHKLDWLEWISIGFCLWLWFYPHPYQLVFIIVLLLPILGLILNGLSRPSLASLVSLSKKNGKDEYDVADFIEFPGIVIMIRVLKDFEFESFYSIIKVGTLGFIILLIILLATHKLIENSNKNKKIIYLSIVANIALYSYAATYGVNCVFDTSDPKIYQSKVINKHISRSKNNTTYYLRVEAWGHHRDAENIAVAGSQYAETEIGQTVSIDYKSGLLGIPWYYIE